MVHSIVAISPAHENFTRLIAEFLPFLTGENEISSKKNTVTESIMCLLEPFCAM